MNNIIKTAMLLGAIFSLSSCFDDYVHDYETPNMGFALQKQVRTVVSTTNKIYVGVSIGGKREVDMNDWANFVIDESLLSGTGLTLLPESYYELSDANTFKVRKSNLPVADVAITFTDEFYADEKCLSQNYALPFRLVATSIADVPDSTGSVSKYGAIRDGAETTIVALKYISGYSGTYYKIGKQTEVDAAGDPISAEEYYSEKDLINNLTLSCTTVGPNTIRRPGAGTSSTGGIKLTLNDEGDGKYTATIEGDAVTLSNATAEYVAEGDYAFYSSDKKAPQFNLVYTYENGGRFYKVEEKLVLRQYAEYELKVETF